MQQRLVYLTQMELPSRSAHSIQILKTCAALSHYGFKVILVVEKGGITPEEVQKAYGVEPVPERFSVVEADRQWRTLLRFQGRETLFYTRSQRWARLAIRTRPLHRVPVVFETHRKAGIFKNDPETGIHEPLERRKRIEWIFRHADGVVCAVEDTYKGLRLRGINALHLWYAFTHTKMECQSSPLSFAYAGTKDLEVVFKAFSRLPWVQLTVYGASDRLRAGVSPPPNVALQGFYPHSELLNRLRSHGGFVATNEGIKLADYLSLDGLIVAPDLPSVREVLGRGAVYFRFGDPDAMANAISSAITSPRAGCLLLRVAGEKREGFLWPEKVGRLVEFLKGIPPESGRLVC